MLNVFICNYFLSRLYCASLEQYLMKLVKIITLEMIVSKKCISNLHILISIGGIVFLLHAPVTLLELYGHKKHNSEGYSVVKKKSMSVYIVSLSRDK